jgi:hypothetical protein
MRIKDRNEISKGSNNAQNTIINIFVYLFYLFIFFLPNFRALQILPPLTEISSSRFVRKGCILILSQHICTNKNLSTMNSYTFDYLQKILKGFFQKVCKNIQVVQMWSKILNKRKAIHSLLFICLKSFMVQF